MRGLPLLPLLTYLAPFPTLRVMFRRIGLRHDLAPANFGLALQSPFAMSTTGINNHGPNVVTPPSNSRTTIFTWADGRPCDQTLTQSITKYGFSDLTQYESCSLLTEDPSFDIQGQWYGGASFGLLQVWPGNATDLLRRGLPSDKRATLRAVYDPLTEPGTKLFDPNVGVEFGAAADSAVDVLAEREKQSYEDQCTSEPATAPFNACTWSRLWARRFAAFNVGSDGSGRAYNTYGRWIVDNAGQFVPVTH